MKQRIEALRACVNDCLSTLGLALFIALNLFATSVYHLAPLQFTPLGREFGFPNPLYRVCMWVYSFLMVWLRSRGKKPTRFQKEICLLSGGYFASVAVLSEFYASANLLSLVIAQVIARALAQIVSVIFLLVELRRWRRGLAHQSASSATPV